MRRRYTYLNVDLCQHLLSKKLIKPFQLYLLMQERYSGKVRLNLVHLRDLQLALGRKSIKTVKNNLAILLKLDFVGYNPKSGYYFIRGIEHILGSLGISSTTAAKVWYSKDVKQLTAFCFAAVAGIIVNRLKAKEWRAERKRKRSIQPCQPLPSHYPISTTFLQKKLGVSLQTVHAWKMKAKAQGYIDVRTNSIRLHLPSSLYHLALKHTPEFAGRIYAKNRALHLRESDLIKPLITFSKRKKIKRNLRKDI